MIPRNSRSRGLPGGRIAGLLVVTAMPLLGGCSFMIDDELSDEPGGVEKADAGADTGDAGATSSSSSGGLECGSHTADCDGALENDCEAHLDDDEDNCGSCGTSCAVGSHEEHCDQGECKQ